MPLPSPIFGQWPIAEPIAAEPIAAIFEGTFSAIGFVPLLAPQSRIGSAVLSQPPEPAIPRDPSQVSATPPVAPVVPKPFSRRKETSGNLAAAFLPYPASEVSSIKSGWREDYWKEPSPMFTQGLMQQDLRYSTECSQCKCVVKEAKLPPAGHISAEELEQEHRLQWLDSLIKEEEKGLRYPRYSKSQVSDDLDPPLRSGLAPPRPPPSVILSSLFDQGVRSKFHGEIKSFSEAKGYGFISCEKVWNLLRCDVHFSLSEVYDVDPQQISEKVRVGSKCTFWCNLDRSGRPQAKVVRITEVAERPPENKTLTETDQVKYEGRIKSFKEDTGYGFISCDETFKKFNRDVFLHHKQLANCKAKVGDLVRFKIFESKGQPKALGLELIEAADAPQSPQASDKAADAPHSPQTASDKAASTQDTASARLLDDEQVAKPEELEDPADLWEQGWTRYRISESSDEYWWCREKTNEYFLESEPDEWSKFLDPNTAKEYWWHQSGRCFWV